MSYDQESNQEETPVQETKVRSFAPPTREQREVLKVLSLEIFGNSNRYKKLYEYDEVLTRKVTETVPGQNGEPDREETKEVPLMAGLGKGSKQSVRKYRTTDEILELLSAFKVKRDEFMAQMKKQQEEDKTKKESEELTKKVQDDLGGSALT